mgnify:CR=1 FL=1
MAAALGRVPAPLERVSAGLRWLSGGRIPVWDRWMPRAAGPLRLPEVHRPVVGRVVYFPSCLTRILGAMPGEGMVPPARAMIPTIPPSMREKTMIETLTIRNGRMMSRRMM